MIYMQTFCTAFGVNAHQLNKEIRRNEIELSEPGVRGRDRLLSIEDASRLGMYVFAREACLPPRLSADIITVYHPAHTIDCVNDPSKMIFATVKTESAGGLKGNSDQDSVALISELVSSIDQLKELDSSLQFLIPLHAIAEKIRRAIEHSKRLNEKFDRAD